MSPRQFSRVFRAETGLSPAKAVEHLRVEAARLMIEQSRHPMEVVARKQALPTANACVAHFCVPLGSLRRSSDAMLTSKRRTRQMLVRKGVIKGSKAVAAVKQYGLDPDVAAPWTR